MKIISNNGGERQASLVEQDFMSLTSRDRSMFLNLLINYGNVRLRFEVDDQEAIFDFLETVDVDIRDRKALEAIANKKVISMELKSPGSGEHNNAPDVILLINDDQGATEINVGNQFSTTDLGIFFDRFLKKNVEILQQEDMAGWVDRSSMNEKENISIKPIKFEFGGGKSLELHAQINDVTGKLLSVTESNGTEMSGTCTIDDTYFDESILDKLQALFNSWGVSFEGSPWETEDQEDFPGYIRFSWDNFNQAIKNGTVVFKEDAATGIWTVEGLFNIL